MSTAYVQPGDTITLTAPTGGVVSGMCYLVGGIVGVAQANVAQTLPFEAMVDGVHTLPKATGTAWTAGDVLYWDNSAFKFTKTSTSNFRAGIAAADAGSSDATGRVRLNGVGVTAVGGAAP